jgi:glutathione peroxidase
MSILEDPIALLDGTPTTLGAITAGRAALLVNVASKCGLTSQYSTLEDIHEKYTARGFTVVGFPCNQFGGQEPGTSEEIAEFCSATYGVTFPLTEKIDVNGPDRHEIYRKLEHVPNEKGEAGDIRWNFEKFVIAPDGAVIARFGPTVVPDDPQIIAVLEALI